MPSNSSAALLEKLAQWTGCTYLSDLRHPPRRNCLRQLLSGIEPDSHSLWEWNDAIEYLLHTSAVFSDTGAAKQYLLARLNQPDDSIFK